ncbi:MAG: TatD family hydrolase [Firmicutes bacterium]|nr:TatD family hydrolase [Bacillota bacterium]
MVDTHVHLDDRRFDADRDQVLQRAWQAGVAFVVNVGADAASSQAAVRLAQQEARVYAAVGVHPHDASSYSPQVEALLRRLAGEQKVVAIGEIGLDYYYDNSPRDRQREVFVEQIELALELDLPIVIHSRDAQQDTLEILRRYAGRARGLMHCFSGSYETAKVCLDLGYYLAFGGSITFKNARRLAEIVKQVPLERMLLETDCPYLTPVPHRGKRNEPCYVTFVAEKVAELKGIDVAEVASVTTQNAKDVFGI